jgi:hypothetical protein
MRTPELIVAAVCAGVLTACGSSQSAAPEEPKADIAKISEVRSSFGPQFQVKDVPKTGIDPKMLQQQKMPAGLTFAPPDCAKFAEGQVLPPGLKGNMAATSAEGDGNRFIALAVETSKPVALNDPGDACRKVALSGGQVRGLVESVDAPQIDGVHTLGTHRVLQTTVNGAPKTGELYNYVAGFGSYLVIVTANPLVIPGRPVAPVNTALAKDLLTAAVKAVKG